MNGRNGTQTMTATSPREPRRLTGPTWPPVVGELPILRAPVGGAAVEQPPRAPGRRTDRGLSTSRVPRGAVAAITELDRLLALGHSVSSAVGSQYPGFANLICGALLGLWGWAGARAIARGEEAWALAGALAVCTYASRTSWDYNLVTTYPLCCCFSSARAAPTAGACWPSACSSSPAIAVCSSCQTPRF